MRLGRDLELPAERFQELRNLAVACLALPDVRNDQGMGRVSGRDRRARLRDDEVRLYARGDRQGRLSVRRVADDREVALLPGDGGRVRPVLQP